MYLNVWSPNYKPVESVEGDKRVLRWVTSQTKPTVGKEADAEKELKKKQVWTAEQELEAKEGKFPSVAWTTFKSWEAVGAWYQGLESDRIEPNAAVKAKVAEITAGKTTDEEKARALYAYVATQIRYIGVAFGIGRYQPHHAGEVLDNQYGDCKDKHTLLAAMLAAAGLHPQAVLIGAGVRFNEAVPSPGSFNHLITTVSIGGQQIWLDSTQEVAPYQALSYVIRDRKALVVPDAGKAKIETTPANLPFESIQKMDAVGTLDKNGTSNSHLKWTFRGDSELILRAAFRQLTPGQYGEVVQRMSQGMGWAGTTSGVEIGKPEDTTHPMTVSYDYKREKSGDWDNLKIIAQFAPIGLPQVDDTEPPVQSLQLGIPRIETSTSAMKLPDGWGAELPEALHAKSPYVTLDQTYRFEKGTIYAERRVEILKEQVPVADWKSYKKWTDDADLAHEQWIQLVERERKESASSGEAADKNNDEDAAKLIRSAYEAIGRHDLETAKTKLDEAKALNANQARLWSTYGYYHYQLGDLGTAIGDYEKELATYPERVGVYRDIATAHELRGEKREAKETLAKWAAADTKNPAPSLSLAVMLLNEGDAAAALKSAEEAVSRLPADKKNDEVIQLILGRAQMKAGIREKGHDTLLAIMNATQNPMMLNDTSYELAEAGEELAADESAARRAVEMLTEQSKTWTLDGNPEALIDKSRQLIAIWDTLGWILYREGKLDEAEDYLKAAWRNTQSDLMAEHVGVVAEARGKKDEAFTAYVLGLAASPPGTIQMELSHRADVLRRAGAKSAVGGDAPERLRNDRKIPLGPAKGMNGVSNYYLLLNNGKVVRAERRNSMGDKMPGGEERLQDTKLTGLWPSGSQANLVAYGTLNCNSDTCEVVLNQQR
jgi:tetratricopeptide (TPR) repeat protein